MTKNPQPNVGRSSFEKTPPKLVLKKTRKVRTFRGLLFDRKLVSKRGLKNCSVLSYDL